MMDIAKRIHPFQEITPMIYAYTAPGVTYLDGWIKIGYTGKQTVEDRVKQQTHTAGIAPCIEWSDFAKYKDGSGEYFHDTDFHRFLTTVKKTERKPETEWFKLPVPSSLLYFHEFAKKKYHFDDKGLEYSLRREQEEAVAMTADFYRGGGDEFLWNCKPRFGKTLTSYDLIRRMDFKHVLVVTNRPSIANSWAEDFGKFIGWREPRRIFISNSDALKGKNGVFTRDEYVDYCLKEDVDVPYVCFESLQNLKGSLYLGGKHDKLKWISDTHFDLLIIDESQEGVDTRKTSRAFKDIERDHTLYLSGTPFKQLAAGRFSSSQIYNWTYADEQQAKNSWDGEAANPYERLPRLAMFTYQISPMVMDTLSQGIDFSEEEHGNYAFDLNEFFRTDEKEKFVYEEEVKKFLHALSTQTKYPFSTPQLRSELAHTMWYLNRVPAANALKKLLKADPIFKDYEVVVAAGNVRENNEISDEETKRQQKAYDVVKATIATHEKTITLTVGQLTVGVTIPEWSGVLMLCNLKSPSAYMQAAFRAQNPCTFTKDGKRYQKETAYVFDFDPARTLTIYDQFANDLMGDTLRGGTEEAREHNIKVLLNFFPVIGEDEAGTMVELDAAKVLTIPRNLVSEEVVRRGFMSNKLFDNISNVFGAPQAIQGIINKLVPAREESRKKDTALPDEPDVPLDDEGNVDVPSEMVIGLSTEIFGEKIYGEMKDELEEPMQEVVTQVTPETSHDKLQKVFEGYKTHVKETVSNKVVEKLSERYGLNKAQENRTAKDISKAVDEKFDTVKEDYAQAARIAEAERKRKLDAAETEEEVKAADTEFHEVMNDAAKNFAESLQQVTQEIIEEKPKELVERLETQKKEQEKKAYEDTIRDHLRGFSRTIPSFLMAYGDRKLTLENLDDYTEDDVFEEVTGITEADFRLLRDGGQILDESTGEMVDFPGHLFKEQAFNDSVQNFLDKKEKLANYFQEDQEKDIFDYIPPQKTNQIFTPRWVVEKMVDQLEAENPGCFDDPKATFADLYMKSGLYITEIVKRLFRSKTMKALYPDDKKRIRHILENQVYGMAPSRIIYLIATSYILGFDPSVRNENPHFAQADAADAAKKGKLSELVEACFGK